MTDSNDTPKKKCTICGVEYPATAEFFWRNKRGTLGLRTDCKTCSREYSRKRRKNNPNGEKIWRAANVEKARERERRWRAANPEYYRSEKRREAARLWYAANTDQHSAAISRYRALKRNLPATFTAEHKRRALEYFNGCCAVCGRPLNDLFGTHMASMDHWIPLSKGGGTTSDNMIPLCHGVNGCNNSKHDNNPTEWLARKHPKQAKKILARIAAYFEWVKSHE